MWTYTQHGARSSEAWILLELELEFGEGLGGPSGSRGVSWVPEETRVRSRNAGASVAQSGQ